MRLIPPSSHKIGFALKPSHLNHIERKLTTSASWLEIPTEEFLTSRGHAYNILEQARHSFPLGLHGVSLNIGNPDGLRLDYLQRLKDLAEQIEPFIISDHICWTGTSHIHLHELLPLPLTKDTLQVLENNIDFAQNFLQRPLAFENIRSFFSFQHNEFTEGEFLAELSRRTDCHLIVDLENLYFNSILYDFDVTKNLAQIPFHRVTQVHLSGATPAWELFSIIAPTVKHLPLTMEYDDHTPHFDIFETDLPRILALMETKNEPQQNAELN